LRTNLSTHIYKSVRVKTDILNFASAIEGALDLERSHVLVPCSAVAYFSLARRRRRARSLAALTGTTDPGEGRWKQVVSPQCGFPRFLVHHFA
jgi:hypothetical protein